MIPIEELIKKQRKEIDRADAIVMQRLVEAYRAKYSVMRMNSEAMVAYIAAHPDMTTEQIKKSARYKELVGAYEDSLSEYSGYLKTEIDMSTKAGMTTGEKHALALIAAYGLKGRAVNINGLPPDVVNVMLKFLAPNSQLYQRIKQLAPYHAQQIAQSLIDAIIQGVNPLNTGKERIAPLLQIAYQALAKDAGLALTDALRMARTAQLWAYRESSRASYMANQDVLSGWYWSAELDDSTCMSCIAQHGTFHEFDEQLDDHYNGRCAMIPAVKGIDSPISQTGVDWFNAQSEESQRAKMGAQYFEAYRGGAFTLEQLSRVVDDDTYGHMHGVTPLYELLGTEPPVRTK